MAETWSKAFGRYLRTLRQRRGLSLQEVCSLSQAFAERVDKGYLSRCENGYQGPAFSKIIPLSRIYEVPADVLLERLELDMELDRVGGPETEGLSYSEVANQGADALRKGSLWHAYALLRDSTIIAGTDELSPRFENHDEQATIALMNCATAATTLGRFRFALNEFSYVRDSGLVSPRFLALTLERLSRTQRELGQSSLARENADRAIAEAERIGERDFLGFFYANRGTQALLDSDPAAAVKLYEKAYRCFHELGMQDDCAKSLNNLAQAFFDLGRLRAARRALVAVDKILAPFSEHRSRALSRLLMGEIELLEHRDDQAEQHWKEAADVARRLNDKTLRFKAEYLLLKQAHGRGQEDVARSIHRRLKKLANWIPASVPELQDFRDLEHDIAV